MKGLDRSDCEMGALSCEPSELTEIVQFSGTCGPVATPDSAIDSSGEVDFVEAFVTCKKTDADEVVLLPVQVSRSSAGKGLCKTGNLDTTRVYEDLEGLRSGATGGHFAVSTQIFNRGRDERRRKLDHGITLPGAGAI